MCRTGPYAWVPIASRPSFWYAVWRRVFRNRSATQGAGRYCELVLLKFRWTRFPQFPQPSVRAPLRRWLLECLRVLMRDLLRGFPIHFRSPDCGHPGLLKLLLRVLSEISETSQQNKSANLAAAVPVPSAAGICLLRLLRFRRGLIKYQQAVQRRSPCPVLLGFCC